jgi:hypothetical protein
MLPPSGSPVSSVPAPTPETVTVLELLVPRAAKESFNYVDGAVFGNIASYDDLNAFAWYYTGGWLTTNRGRRGMRRIHRGNEDSQVRLG